MLQIQEYCAPHSIEEAYRLLTTVKGSRIIGGGMWMRLAKQNIPLLIDPALLNLDYIREKDNSVEVGAMCSLRAFETSDLIGKYFQGFFRKCFKNIVGVPFRNMATIGGSVYGRFGFSDVITALLVCECEVTLYKAGNVKLVDFLTAKHEQDILLSICLQNSPIKASYQTLRHAKTDFPIISLAAANNGNGWKVSVGGRPGIAQLFKVSLSSKPDDKEIADTATYICDNTLLASNDRGSADYRKAMIKPLLEKAVAEIGEIK